MKVKWKQVKTLKAHCGECGQRLSGNNSINLPYECKCGTWKKVGVNDFKLEDSDA